MPARTSNNKRSDLEVWAIENISKLAEQIANCLGFLVINNSEFAGKTDKEKIAILFNLEFDRNQTAAILEKDPDTVSVNLSQMGLTGRGKN